MNVALVAHPDDETFGCGGTLAKWAPDVVVVALADGVTSRGMQEHRSRHEAFVKAGAILGVSGWESKGLPDQRLDALDFLDLAKGVTAIIEKYQPDRILTHHRGDLNLDHRLVAEAVLVACRPPNKAAIWTFETPSSTEWNYGTSSPFQPNVFVDITDTMEKKLQALDCYEAELRPVPHPRNRPGILTRAMYWGQVAGLPYAEPFMVVRDYA